MKTTNEVAVSHGIVLTNDNAKKFATRLKKTLKENSIDFKTSKCYDILAKTFGSSNWHELSQHLNPENNITNKKEQPVSTSKLNSIFDLPWVEFKYIISKITTELNFDFHTKEFLDILLDIVHENQPRSEIYWEKINEFLSGSERNFRTDIEYVPIYDYTAILNPTLTEVQVENYIKKVAKSGNVGGGYTIRFKPEKIEMFFTMLKFLKNENFILREINTNFAVSEVLQYKNNKYSSHYPFINNLIHLADINNEYISYNPHYANTLSFHDVIIQLYSRVSMLNHIYIQGDKILSNYAKQIAIELFENNQFIHYLFSHLKVYVKNHLTIKLQQRDVNFGHKYPQGVTENINTIEYNVEYVPHGLIFKAMLEKIDFSCFTPELVNNDNQAILSNHFKINIELKANQQSMLIQEFKNPDCIEYLKEDKFKPGYKQSTVFYSY